MIKFTYPVLLALGLCACSCDKQMGVEPEPEPQLLSGTVEGVAAFHSRQFPPDSRLVAALDRSVPAVEPANTMHWESVDLFETPIKDSPVTFTLRYTEESVELYKYRVRVWAEDTIGTLLLAATEYQVELPVRDPLRVMLRYVADPRQLPQPGP